MTMRSFFWPVIASMALAAFSASAHAQQRPASSVLCGIVSLPGMDCPASPSGPNQVRDSSGASTVSPQRAPAPTESSLPFTGGGGGALGLVDGLVTGTQIGRFPGCQTFVAGHWSTRCVRYAPVDSEGKGGGCIQTAPVWVPDTWHPATGACTRRVTFPRPFIGTPHVIPTAHLSYSGWCRGAWFDQRAHVISVTPTHFDVHIPGASNGCIHVVVNQLDWIASMQ